jgi:exosortase C (VPDSG-CTERM-specific)
MTSSDKTTVREVAIRAPVGRISEPNTSSHRNSWRFWSGASFVIVLLAAFSRPLLALADYAGHSSLHSYTLLVPIVCAYLLYLRRGQLPKKYGTDLPLAMVLLAGGLGLFLVAHWLHATSGSAPDNSYFVLLSLSFVCCLTAGGFVFLGRDWMRAAAFPLAYLIFLVPMPDAMANTLETASKYASAEVANLFFRLSGTPFVRAGNIFQLSNITIEVAQECSGIRSSWVLLITSILAANLFLGTPWRRVALVFLVIPLAIMRNAFRILVIGLLCVNAGPQMINSMIHRRGGPPFFVLSLVPLLLALWWLHRGEVRSQRIQQG